MIGRSKDNTSVGSQQSLGAMTNTSDFRCVKGISYAVADAIKIGWDQIGTQAKGFFVALLFRPHPGKQKGNKETHYLCLDLVPTCFRCIGNCLPDTFNTSEIRCVGHCPQ
jgi:hypothetical protein